MRWTISFVLGNVIAVAVPSVAARAQGPCDGFSYHSGCYCVPNVANYGHFPTLWRQWPGEPRPDQTFPQAVGREPIPVPRPHEAAPPPVPRARPRPDRKAEPLPSEPRIEEATPPQPGGLRFDDAEPVLPGPLPGLEPVLPEGLPGLQDESSPLPPAEPGDLQPMPPLPGGQPSPFGASGPSLSAPRLIDRQPVEALQVADRLKWRSAEPRRSDSTTDRTAKPTTDREAAERASFSQPAPLSLDGFCPVALGDRERWVRGDPKLLVEYEDRTYQLRDETALHRFLAAPHRYAPAASGNDCVALKQHGRRTPGRTDFCARYENRLYMFSSAASLKKFQADPQRYAVER